MPASLTSRHRESHRERRCGIPDESVSSKDALAGGIPSWLLAKRQSNETLARDREQRREKEKTLAFAVCVKLLEISNSLVLLRNHVAESEALRLLPDNIHMEPWQTLQPLSGQTDEGMIRFTPDEMAVFMAAKHREFVMDAMLVARRHASSLEAFAEYCERRSSLLLNAPVPDSFEGDVGRGWITDTQRRAMMVHTIPLNAIAATLPDRLAQDLALVRSVCEQFGPIVKNYFDDPGFPGLAVPSDAELDLIVSSGLLHAKEVH